MLVCHNFLIDGKYNRNVLSTFMYKACSKHQIDRILTYTILIKYYRLSRSQFKKFKTFIYVMC